MVKKGIKGFDEFKRQIGAMISRGKNPQPLLQEIVGILQDEVDSNFAAHGRPPWPELAQSTKKAYAKKGYSQEPTLNRSAAGLVSSIQQFITGMSGGLSTNKPYAAIHNFGGDIVRKPHSTTTRLRTDAKGNLLRQGKNGNLAIFAKKSHKRTQDYTGFSTGYTIHIPQREFFSITATGVTSIEAAAGKFITGI